MPRVRVIVPAQEEALRGPLEALVVVALTQVADPALERTTRDREALPEAGEPVRAVRRVAGEELVSAVAPEGHLHVPRREPRQEESRQVGRIGEGLVETAERRVDDLEQVLLAELLLDVVRSDESRDRVRVLALVEGGVGEGDGERLERPRRSSLREGRDARGIDPAAQKHAD